MHSGGEYLNLSVRDGLYCLQFTLPTFIVELMYII